MRTNEAAEPSDTSKRRWDMGHAALGAMVLGLGITSLWLWSEVADEKSDSKESLSQNEQRFQRMMGEEQAERSRVLGATKEEAAQHQANAFAAAIQPIMSFKGQVPEITDRSIQAATENLARSGSYSLVSVTDASGKVLASSDLTVVGRDAKAELKTGVATVQGQNQAVAEISTEGSKLGYVIVRLRS